MSKFSLFLAAFAMASMIAFIAPNVIARNRGHALRNIAIWLAIILALALLYKSFAPTGSVPVLDLPRR